jgi:ubiquinone/menaquinone biosynthesis C-methylase UbiE
MVLCCLIPVIAIGALLYINANNVYLPFLLLLLCPLIALLMFIPQTTRRKHNSNPPLLLNETTKETQRKDPADIRYSRIAWLYDIMNHISEAFYFSKHRKEILSKVRGKILEVGVGTGQSFKDYPPGQEIVGIDISEKMLESARKKAKNYLGRIELRRADVQNLPFEDNTFDTIFTSCVFCSVTDPVKGLEQLRRVLKKDGQILMLEHVRSKNRVLGFFMDLLNPIIVRLVGANINRDTVKNIRKAGLHVKEERNLSYDIVKSLQVTKKITA